MIKETKSETGRRGEEAVLQHFAAKGARLVTRHWRAPYGSGAGEVDLVLEWPAAGWGTRARVLLVEVKSHRWWGAQAALELLTEGQRRRLRGATAYWRSLRRDAVVESGLAWFDPDSGRIQFLEEACYI